MHFHNLTLAILILALFSVQEAHAQAEMLMGQLVLPLVISTAIMIPMQLSDAVEQGLQYRRSQMRSMWSEQRALINAINDRYAFAKQWLTIRDMVVRGATFRKQEDPAATAGDQMVAAPASTSSQ